MCNKCKTEGLVGALNKMISKRRWTKNQGLTVLEMMIVLAAIAVIFAVAVPGTAFLADKYHMQVASASIITGLELARSEASARSSTVVMCPSSNGHTCRKDSDWSLGWLVFSDGNGDGDVQDIELIKAFAAPSQKIHIQADGAVHSRAAFTTTGLNPDNNSESGQFQICPGDPAQTATLVTVDSDGWVQKISTRNAHCAVG
jgi:type IV fimbrial biogenesis protein FimT